MNMDEITVIVLVISLICFTTYIRNRRLKMLGIACIFLTMVCRFDFIPIELSTFIRGICKLLELILLIVFLSIKNKKHMSLTILNIITLLIFIIHMVPVSIILNGEPVGAFIFGYGTGISEAGTGITGIDNINNILFCTVYFLLDVNIFLSDRLSGKESLETDKEEG